MDIKMAKTIKYIVTEKHTLGHDIGTELNLTESQAKNLVGKVTPKTNDVVDSAKSDLVKKLNGEIESLKAQAELDLSEIETLKATIKSMTEDALIEDKKHEDDAKKEDKKKATK